MKRVIFTLLLAACTVLVLVLPASAERGSWNNWHVHDGATGTDPNGLTHRGLVFFPEMFAGYAADPSLWAYCTDATDKALVGGDGGAKGAAGQCRNEDNIIHLQIMPDGAQAPGGPWLVLSGASAGPDTVYYFLTPR